MMLIAKAPVRISFGGGGTDLPAYYEKFGGAVLSVTINKYFYSLLRKSNNGVIEIESSDYQLHQQFESIDSFSYHDALMIPKAVLSHFNVEEKVHLSLKSDIPPGSGLGLSGAVTTSLIKLISMFKKFDFSKKEIAQLASEIEINCLKRPIGMQDQYASTFGGLNFILFEKGKISVEPLNLNNVFYKQFENSLMLFYTGMQRDSAQILAHEKEAIEKEDPIVLSSLDMIKEKAFQMRDALLAEDLALFGQLLKDSWEYKKMVSKDISNSKIDGYYNLALQNGAVGGKITGAGAGGFLLFFCEERYQKKVRQAMSEKGLQEFKFRFENEGVYHVLDQLGNMRSTTTPEGYLLAISSIVKELDTNKIDEITNILFNAYTNDKQVFIMGNGGSAATASHFCSDLAKTTMCEDKRGFRAIPLTDNIPLMTAWGNDTGYDNIFYGQLLNLLNSGDIVIGISGGGISGNIVKALELAKERSAETIGFTGFSGGKIKEIVKKCLIVPSENYQFIEDIHMIIVHLIVSVLKEKISQKGDC
ncbi:MAG: SIS domain-containing protein [Pseudomonadota bacterium]